MVWRFWEWWGRGRVLVGVWAWVCLQCGLELLIEWEELVGVLECHKAVRGIKVGLVGYCWSLFVWTAYCTVTLSLVSLIFYFLYSFVLVSLHPPCLPTQWNIPKWSSSARPNWTRQPSCSPPTVQSISSKYRHHHLERTTCSA